MVTYSKAIFELPGDTPPRELVMPVGAVWRAAGREDIVAVMGEALATSLDVADRAAVDQYGADGAVTRLLDMAGNDFRWDESWWQTLIFDGEVAGCVMPVVYRQRLRASEDEGTIYHLGVRPAYRGRGFGGLLLARASNELLKHGVWRIYCDTAATNQPMVDAFVAQRWRGLGSHEAAEWT